MVGAVQRHKILILLISLALVGILAFAWYLFSRRSLGKIPSRGVFVLEDRQAYGVNANHPGRELWRKGM